MGLWDYRARPYISPSEAVGDGDTVELVIDLGFNASITERVRIRGIDTYETPSHLHFPNIEWRHIDLDKHNYRLAKEQQEFAVEWYEQAVHGAEDDDGLNEQWPLRITTHKDNLLGPRGRWIADVNRIVDGASYTEDVLERWPEVVYEPDWI